MKKLFLLFASALLIPTANAVEEDIHEKCLKASDYKGCIEVFSGAIKDQIKPGTQNVKLNIDTQVIADGNQCPSEFAYAGGGYCRRVVCEYAGLFGTGHRPDLAGKGFACDKGRGQMRWGEWDKEKVRASVNPECPDISLKIGWQSSCHIVGKSILDKYVDKNYQEVIAASEKYPEALNIPMTRTIYGAALWYSNQRDEAVRQYVRAAKEITASDKNPWLVWVSTAAGLYSQDPLSSDAIVFAKKALENEPKLADSSFQIANYTDQESLRFLRGLLSRPELSSYVNKVRRSSESKSLRDR